MINLPAEFSQLLREGDRSVQEAESLRYGANAFMVLPLSTGKIAVLGSMRDLHSICDTWQEACQSALSIPMNVWRRSASGEGPKVVREQSLVAKKSAGDLGL